jgi:hypothetical protein
MNTVFLSYTYNPHPGFEAETSELVKNVRLLLEAMGVAEVLTGQDLGGQQLSSEVMRRIERSDALIALETPWKELAGDAGYIASDWVRREFSEAETLGKELIAVVHEKVLASSAFKDREHAVYRPSELALLLMKLMRTIALWKKKLGRSHQVEILPFELAEILDEDDPSHRCFYRTLVEHEKSEWKLAQFWHEPGGVVAYLTGISEGAKVQMKVTAGEQRWQSPFTALHRIKLLKKED